MRAHIDVLFIIVSFFLGFSLSAPSSPLDIPHQWDPTLLIGYSIPANEIRPYIDPRLTIDTFSGSAYLFFLISNVSTPGFSLPGKPFFNGMSIYTYTTYQGKRYTTELYHVFDVLPIALLCNFYQLVLLQCKYSHDMSMSLDNANYKFSFHASAAVSLLRPRAEMDVSITWDPTVEIDYTTSSTLGSWLYGPGANENFINAPFLAEGRQYNYAYPGGLYECTATISSTFISSFVGSLPSLTENSPTLCAFTPSRYAIVSPGFPRITN